MSQLTCASDEEEFMPSLLLVDTDSEGENVQKCSEADKNDDEKSRSRVGDEEVVAETKKRKKVSALIDSESSEEEPEREPEVEKPLTNDPETRPKQKKKISALIDSDSSGDEAEKSPSNLLVLEPQKREKISALIDTDSSEDEPQKEPQMSVLQSLGMSESESNKSKGSDDESAVDSKKKKYSKKKPKSTDLLASLGLNLGSDSDSSSDESASSKSVSGNESGPEALPGKHPDAPRPPKRMSAKQAAEQMKIIQSESQRMAREANVDIPYHRPKSHSLKEFLERKAIRRSGEMKIGLEKTTAAAIKMNPEQLKEYAKMLEEREREAKEFFKSESEAEEEESDSKEEPKDTAAEVPERSTAELLSEMDSILSKVDAKVVSLDEERPVGPEPSEEAGIDDETCKEPVALVESETCKEPVALVDSGICEETLVDSGACEKSEVVPEASNSVNDTSETEVPKEVPTVQEAEKQALKKQKLLSLIGALPEIKTSSFDFDMELDLDTGEVSKKQPTGAELLRAKYINNACFKPCSQSQEEVQIVSTENGFHVETFKIKKEGKVLRVQDSKPGEKLTKLRDILEQKIKADRLEKVLKRDDYNKKLEAEQKEYSGDEDEESEEEVEEVEGNNLAEAEEEVETVEKEPEMETEDNEEESSSSEEEEEEPSKSRKGRILAAFEDSDEEPVEVTAAPLLDKSTSSVPWDENSLEKDDLVALCSGQFETTQVTQKTDQPVLGGLFNENQTQMDLDDVGELCSGQFVTQGLEVVVKSPEKEAVKTSVENSFGPRRLVILSSDEEREDNETSEAPRVKKLKKKRPVLEISDDESESEEEVEEVEEEQEEEPETFVDYDSEENEVEVRMTKEERVKRANHYFDDEAELSGSEYESADEDERELDKLDRELGDEEQFDQDQLRNELERIHMRRVMDQDAREVKQLQNMFFEDEENDGVGRTRKFMWKNTDMQFSLEAEVDKPDAEVAHLSDEENEEQWRKMRHEREVLLRNQKENSQVLDQEQVDPNEDASKKRLTIKKTIIRTSETILTKESSPFLISFDQKAKESRQSFLARGEETLSKLATVIKDTEFGSTAVNNGRNFVFAVMTPPEKDPEVKTKKRKSETGDVIQSGSKKSKFSDESCKKRLLDSLA